MCNIHTEDVAGSNPASPTKNAAFEQRFFCGSALGVGGYAYQAAASYHLRLTHIPTSWYVSQMPKRQLAREKLLDASLGLIRERGFSAMTVDNLCARAGVTKGAFFHYFKTKDELGVAAAQHWSEVTEGLFAGAS